MFVHLGHLPPVEAVEEVVGPSLIGVGLQCGLHPRSSSDPNPLLFMIPPVPVKPGHAHTRGNDRFKQLVHHHKRRETFLLDALIFICNED